MQVTFRLPHLTGVLLLAATPSFSIAESPMPDPIAPAVIGRPLDQIAPARPARQKPAARNTNRPRQVATGNRKAKRPDTSVAAATVTAKEAAAPQQPAKQVPVQRSEARTVAMAPSSARPAARTFRPGAYFDGKDQRLVDDYYQAHPLSEPAANWKIGEPIPPKAALTGVPDALRAALPPLPPGHQYVQVDGEVVLVAVQSRTVVDGITRGRR